MLVVGYQYSVGDIVTDPSLPIAGVESRINFAQVSYQRTVSLFGRTTNLQLNLPYSRGLTEGFVEGEFRNRHISAIADARVRLSVNLRGAPAMDAAGFQALRAKPRTIVGASLLIQSPTGGYEPDKLINAGTNRWAVKPALDNVEQPDLQRNSRIGATLVFPVKKRHAIRISLSTGIVAESGGDFESFSLNYAYAWR